MSRHDISDEKWKIVEPILSSQRNDPRGRKPKDNRLMFNGILWIIKTGAPWRDLPKEFGSWQTVYKRFAKWTRLFIWNDLFNSINKNADFESIMLDSSYVKLHQHGCGAKGGQCFQAIGKSKGGLTTKIHAVVDGLGNPLRIKLTGGNVHDMVPSCELISGIKAGNILADRAYDADKFIDLAQSAGCKIVIPPKSNRLEPRTYDKHIYKERHLVECFFAKLKAFRRVSTRYEKLALTFNAVVLIAACLVWLQ